MEIVTVEITPKIFKEASERNIQYQKKYGNIGTHRLNKDRQRMTGYLAEACIVNTFPDIKYSGVDEFDFLCNNLCIDSKAQGCNSKPLDHYSATLYEEQKNRETDFYIFSRIKNDFTLAWICGIISKESFFATADFRPSGTQTNNFTYDQSRYEISYNKLHSIYNFLKR